MGEQYYQSAYTGEQIDESIGRIVNGEIDRLADSASSSASAAQSAYNGVKSALNNLPDGDTLIINDLTTGGTKAALSAEMGKSLNSGKVSKAGDTVTGNLVISKSVPTITALTSSQGHARFLKNASDTVDNGTQMIDTDANGNKAGLIVRGQHAANPEIALKLLVTPNGGTSSTYNVLHTGNKSLIAPSDIGAVNKAGDTMTGNLTISKQNYPTAYLKSRDLGRETRVLKGSSTELQDFKDNDNYSSLSLSPETTAEANLLRLLTKTNGEAVVVRQVLHTGNLSMLGVAKISTGTYTGTGTYGEENPCTLTFEFKPKFVMVYSANMGNLGGEHDGGDQATPGVDCNTIIAAYGASSASRIGRYDYGITYDHFAWGEDYFEWYNGDSAAAQLNESGVTYCYTAIG